MEQLVFGPFCLDLASARLIRDGIDLELRPQAFQALKTLLQNSGRPVDYDQMIRQAWEGNLVSRHTVAVTVGEVKKALRECGSWISYRPKLGYRLEVPGCDDLIRKGWHFFNQRTRDGLENALDCFEQAARENRTDPRPLEATTLVYLTLGAAGMRSPRDMASRFRDAHARAIALAGWTPELRSDWGHALHMFERNAQEAEEHLLQSRREKQLLRTYIRLAMLYTAENRLDTALEILSEAQSVEPLGPMLPATEINIRFFRREFDCAVACGRKAVELHPYLQLARAFYGQALEFTGRGEDALEQYRIACTLSPDLPWLRALEAACLARNGQPRQATRIHAALEQLRRTEYVDAYYMALLRDALGDRDAAFAELHRAVEENSCALPILAMDPKMDWLRQDRRFEPIRLSLRPERHRTAESAA